MGLFVSCRDMGVEWCDFEAHADDEHDLLEVLTAHLADAHEGDEEQLRTPEGTAMLHAMLKET